VRFGQLVLPHVDATLIFGIFAAMQKPTCHLLLRKRCPGLAVIPVDFTALTHSLG
jgi:hypothetical protein